MKAVIACSPRCVGPLCVTVRVALQSSANAADLKRHDADGVRDGVMQVARHPNQLSATASIAYISRCATSSAASDLNCALRFDSLHSRRPAVQEALQAIRATTTSSGSPGEGRTHHDNGDHAECAGDAHRVAAQPADALQRQKAPHLQGSRERQTCHQICATSASDTAMTGSCAAASEATN